MFEQFKNRLRGETFIEKMMPKIIEDFERNMDASTQTYLLYESFLHSDDPEEALERYLAFLKANIEARPCDGCIARGTEASCEMKKILNDLLAKQEQHSREHFKKYRKNRSKLTVTS